MIVTLSLLGCTQPKIYVYGDDRALEALVTLSENAPTKEMRVSARELLFHMSEQNRLILSSEIRLHSRGLTTSVQDSSSAITDEKNTKTVRLEILAIELTQHVKNVDDETEKEVLSNALRIIQAQLKKMESSPPIGMIETSPLSGLQPTPFKPLHPETTDSESEPVEAFIDSVKGVPPHYQQPAFQCLDEHRNCRRDEIGRLGCALALAVCFADGLLTFSGDED